MLNLASSVLIFLAVSFASSFASPPPSCSPDSVKESVTCAALGTSVPTGTLYADWGFFFVPLMSPYYGARIAAGFGLPCPANKTLQKELDITTPWSGLHWLAATDLGYGGNLAILRVCVAPTDTYPFLCTGIPGTPCTNNGANLGTLSYISLLQDDLNRWTLFGQCWNAKTPEFPNRVETATSWMVFSKDKTLCDDDITKIKRKLRSLGFSTLSANLIAPDYSTP